jgi:hypothetical protein
MFNARARFEVLRIDDANVCLVIDDVLLEPKRWVTAAAEKRAGFAPPANAYPGYELHMPESVTQSLLEFLRPSLQPHFGIRRILDAYSRLAMATLAPAALSPAQSLCHRDRLKCRPGQEALASVLYLFDDPSLGGTAFFRPRLDATATDQLLYDSNALQAPAFFSRYGLQPGYMTDSNAYFEKTHSIPARWNRLLVYSGMLFHSGEINNPQALTDNPETGRLSLNGFFSARRNLA